jgi:p-hydroxybenzoate 3-monooxygenase
MRTQVAIVGGGPAGTLLSILLHQSGISSVVLEARTREYVLSRVRAGVLEQGSADILRENGLGARMDQEGFVHDGVNLAYSRKMFRVDFKGLTGAAVMIYGQTEVQKDLYAAHEQTGELIVDEAMDVELHDVESESPWISYSKDGDQHRLDCEYVAGCDGFHGVSRTAIPSHLVRNYEREYPFGWLGILSETPPVNDELIYTNHSRGFALCSMRHQTLSRYYLQCSLDTKLDEWPDDRFWEELEERLPHEAAERLITGPSVEKSITPLRSFVSEPMRFGRLFLAGDAAHIVPPTGAKGLNLAISDVTYLARAFAGYYKAGDPGDLDAYSEIALTRVWKAVRFSWWMTTLMHHFDDEGGFGLKVQEAELSYLSESEAARRSMAENYVGLAL